MKKTFKKLIVTCFLLLFACLTLRTPGVSAYGLNQTNPAAKAITLTWAAERNATAYRVFVGKDYSSLALYKSLPASATSVTITGLPAGCKRYVKVEYDYTSSLGHSYTSTVGTGYYKTTPGKVAKVKQDKWWYFLEQFSVKWEKQDGADGYEYKAFNNKGKKIASGTRYSNSADVTKKVSNTSIYTVQVRAYTTINNKKYYGTWSDKCYCFTQPRIKSANVSGSKLVVKWGKVAGATGYDIYVSTKPAKGYKKVKTVGKSTSSATISSLKGKKFSSKTTYYVYVVTKKKVGKTTNTSGKLYYWNTKNGSFGYF